MNQIALPFDWPAAESDEAFVVGDANAAAVRHLKSFARWPVAATILVGPRKSGRSLLGRVFAAQTGATLLDDAEQVAEQEVFSAWNLAQQRHVPLLLIADHAPPVWTPRLPDLASRLAVTPAVRIGQPDDDLIVRLLPRLLERRGLFAPPELVRYLAPRLPRTYHELLDAVDRLDAAALAQRRAVSVPLAREALGLAAND